MLDDESLALLLPDVVDLAERAAVEVMTIYDAHDITVERKADDSPVTNADLAANRVIIDGLMKLTPTIPIVSEESPELVTQTDFMDQAYWLVDPVDGTKEFIKRNGEFTVNIGLIQAGKPVLGVVVAPALGKTYYGAQGAGAWRRDDGALARPIAVAPHGDTVRVVVSRSHLDQRTQDWLADRQLTVASQLGSSLKFTAIAEGSADLFPRLLSGPHEWDLAAAHAVLLQAGGDIWSFGDARPIRYGQPMGVVEEHLAGGPDAPRFIS